MVNLKRLIQAFSEVCIVRAGASVEHGVKAVPGELQSLLEDGLRNGPFMMNLNVSSILQT